MEEVYQPETIELSAHQYWQEQQSFTVREDLSKEKFFCLTMFPYPSGRLHMGHARVFTINDVMSRYHWMQGKQVLQPMGWDAFGLPAENAAIAHQVPPAEWTYQNIATMKAQLNRLGFAYDWSREIATCDPDYYRWEQWLFIKLYEKGLAYKKNAVVNWDPVDQTVLANEQVVDGKGWRSVAPVEQREINQWFLKITDYADELLAGLDELTEWPEQVRTMQRNWIGRSEGTTVEFAIAEQDDKVAVYTTRVDTLYGCTYLAIAPTHPLALAQASHHPELQAFIDSCRQVQVAEEAMATLEKQGMATGLYAIHPLTNDKLPIWVANFVLMNYGCGAVMSVPAHDQRDYEFALKYGLPLRQVITPENAAETCDLSVAAFSQAGILINSEAFDGQSTEAAKKAITDTLVAQGAGSASVNYRLRDWGVSRQRYWGCPIPIIYCDACGTVPVPEQDLPVTLPDQISFTGNGNPLANHPPFYQTTCPQCGNAATRETDTFDTFVESSWYYARYACPDQDRAMLDDRATYWTPVDQYVGGIEHAVMHLLYARFFHRLLRDEGFVNSNEPFTRLLTQGMVLKDGAKMSKSKGNIVNPQELVDQYGADTVRLFAIFASPPEQSLEWSDSGVEGAHRFLKRLWAFAYRQSNMLIQLNDDSHKQRTTTPLWEQASHELQTLRRDLYLLLNQARYDYERQQFNTVVSTTMKLVNLLHKLEELAPSDDAEDLFRQHLIHKGLAIALQLLAPIAPHITHQLWRDLNYGNNILASRWPKVVNDALKTESVELVVQVNGKRRAQITVSSDASEADILAAAQADETIQKYLQAARLIKSIVVPGRLVNLVVGQ